METKLNNKIIYKKNILQNYQLSILLFRNIPLNRKT